MNLDVALGVVQLENHKPEVKAAAVAMSVKNVICSPLFVLLAEKTPRFLSNRLVTNQFIAVSAMYPQHVTTFKSFNVETFLGFRAWEGFLLLAGEKVKF